MAITDENGGFFGGDLSIIILFFLFMMMGGWGNGGFGGLGGGDLYPWMNNSQNINDGFRDQMLNNTVTGIQNSITSGFGNVQTALCGGFAGVNASISNGFAQTEIAANARQLADLERSFAAQTATTAGITGLQAQLAQCCCDNRMATVQTQNIVQSENAATRLAIQEQTQAILDKMCEQEIEQLRSQNVSLQNQVNMLNLAASQTAQTAALVSDNAAQTQYLINKLTPTA